MRNGLSWSWSLFLLGLVLALPAAVATPFDPSIGLGLAIGVIPAAANRLAPRRAGRWVTVLVGIVAAAAMTFGASLTRTPVLAVVAIFVIGLVAPLWATRSRAGALVVSLALPLTGIGLSFSSVGTTAVLGLLMIGGSVYAWLVSLAWPQRLPPVRQQAPPPGSRAALSYGVLLGCAGALAATTGYLLHLEHVGWVTGACLLVMRPTRSLLFLRTIGRAVSVTLGAFAAAAFSAWGPPDLVLAIAVVLVLGAATATHDSRWYVTPGFTTFIALSLILQGNGESPAGRFNERTLETLLGVGIALIFGWLVPAVLSRGESASVGAER
ncbi:FUSC family protein [Leifsonia sp. F6_8S_P_1B]|uniref:FUSC family protein n=1 Tax=Leifsonia williamsii TaxID=3035919 RepID=A0ABT8K6W3_9MICO|nr:FUSC family protein [Leifsonia williamsii]MDN4613181.1 FUSC family protein [Leifsonia williamsii]